MRENLYQLDNVEPSAVKTVDALLSSIRKTMQCHKRKLINTRSTKDCLAYRSLRKGRKAAEIFFSMMNL